MVLGAEATLKCHATGARIPEGNVSFRHDEIGSDQPTLADLYQNDGTKIHGQLKIMETRLDQQDKKLDELMEKTRVKKGSASLEQDA